MSAVNRSSDHQFKLSLRPGGQNKYYDVVSSGQTAAAGMLHSTALHNSIRPDFFNDFLVLLQDLIDGHHEQGGKKIIWAHSSIISFRDAYFYLHDQWGVGADEKSEIVVKIKPLHLVRYLWHFVVCQIEKTDQEFSLLLEVIPSADLPDPLD